STVPREDDRPALRVRADRFALAGPKFTVPVEVDNAPPGATLELSLGRLQDGAFVADRTQKLPEARRRHIGFNPVGPDGAMLFEASIGDWTVELDAAGLLGQRQLLARLVDVNGQDVRRVVQTVTLDDSPPERVRFVDLPKQARRDMPLSVQA